MSRCRCFVLTTALVLVASASPSAAAVTYRPPVDAPVVDGFHLPDGPYGAGNRGLEYATAPGTPVRAIGGGQVVFAGVVARTLHVTVLHPDGLRSSYSYLAEVGVAAGDEVVIGQTVGTTGERLHLGVRSAGTYLDPAALFTAVGVRLVPVEADPPRRLPEETEPRPADRGDPIGYGSATWAWLLSGGGGSGAGTLAPRS